MSAVKYHLDKQLGSGTTFSIIFGTIAASVLVGCAIRGFMIPKFRKKFLRNPARTKWNDSPGFMRKLKPRFRTTSPSHLAVKPLLPRPSSAQILPIYNPRSESPFPFYPTYDNNFAAANPVTHIRSAPGAPTTFSSDSFFTPARRYAPEYYPEKGKHHTIPTTNDAMHSMDNSTDFGDAKYPILAVPEPPALKARDVRRPPAVTRHLQKFGTLETSPASPDRLLHPNKLFRAIQKEEVRSSLCSSASLCANHRESDPAAVLAAKEMIEAVDRAIEEGADWRRHDGTSSNGKSQASSCGGPHNGFSQDDGTTVMQRLRSYRSLTGSRRPKLTRAGTVTRPKIDVDELRKFYGQDRKNQFISMVTLPRELTPSIALTTAETGFDTNVFSTPAASPALAPSKLQLLPTRLRPSKNNANTAQTYQTLGELKEASECTDQENHGLSTLRKDSPLEKGTRCSQGFCHARRCNKQAPLKLEMNDLQVRKSGHRHRRSLTESDTVVIDTPIKPSHRKSGIRASSMYSGDSHGFSLDSTLVTPDFPSPIIDTFADHDICGNPFNTHGSDKDQNDELAQLIDGLAMPSMPHQRNLSPCIHSVTYLNQNKAATYNDQEPRIELQEDITKPNKADMASEGVVKRGTAPGGAKWI